MNGQALEVLAVGLSGVNLVVLVGALMRFARWTGVVDTRLKHLEKAVHLEGNAWWRPRAGPSGPTT